MKVRELRSIFEQLQEVFSSAGSRQSARDLHSVARVLDGAEDQTVEQFVSESKRLLDPQPPQAEPTTIPTSNESVISHYVNRLLAAGNDRESFETILKALRADKRIGKEELFQIAHRFFNEPTGSSYRFKLRSKAAAYEMMRKKFVERAQLDSKFGIIEKLTQGR